jgi:four helix bundle protein
MINYAQATEALKKRTRDFALRIIQLVRSLPRSRESRIIGDQLLRAGTAVGANYRAACRARSMKEFLAKIGVVLEESDESAFWLDLTAAAGIMKPARLAALQAEANELTAIFAASWWTTKRKLQAARKKRT